MEYHTVTSYDKDLSTISVSIVSMALLVKDMIILADKSIQDNVHDYYQLARETDSKINEYDEKIEDKSINMLALRQPMAVDLRHIVAALKVAVIFERMGDLAKNITKRFNKISISNNEDVLAQIHKMSTLLVSLMEDVIDSYNHKDTKKAYSVFLGDNVVDDIYWDIISTLHKRLQQNPVESDMMLQLIFAVKNFERIGDYISKVASINHYILTGNRRFSNEKL